MNAIFPGQVGQEIKVFMETSDGHVFKGRCIAGQITVNQDRFRVEDFSGRRSVIPNRIEWDIELNGIGAMTWIRGSEIAPMIAARFLPQEWQCEYCERANPIKAYQCGSCGWYRGLIADVVKEAGIWRYR